MSKKYDRKGADFVFLPLGGVGEIGMNLYLYGYGRDGAREWLIVDMGVTFGGETEPGVELILPDIRFNSIHVQTMVQHVLKRCKKSTATRLIYDAMDMIQERTQKNPIDVFDGALKNVGPVMEVRPRRVGGATYQVPMEVSSDRRTTLAIRWILSAAHERAGQSFSDKLASELIDAFNETGSAIRKRDETHKMAEANRAFSHYRI